MNLPPIAVIVQLLIWHASAQTSQAATLYYAQPYFGRSDSPWFQGILAGTIYLEDFEDRKLDTPFVTTAAGHVSIGRGITVDEDDGIKDGRYTGGYVWTSSDLRFNFSANDQGKLPEFVGGVFLGGNPATTGVDIYSEISAYDSSGLEITEGLWRVLQPRVAPGTPVTSSIADRFTGIYYPGGISGVFFRYNTLLDHLQYGYAIPEPAATLLLAGVAVSTLLRRRRPWEPH